MLITQEVEITLNNRTQKYYEDLGYDIPKYKDKRGRYAVRKGTKIIVKVSDLSKGNYSEIILECDYCGKKYTSTYYDYRTHNLEGTIHKDACGGCSHLKSAEANMLLYGVSNSQKRPEVRQKFKDTCLERYNAPSFLNSNLLKRDGENHWNWQGGITSENRIIRNSNEYEQWRIYVFERDNYTCQICNKSGGITLHAHHLDNFADNDLLRLDVDNGITLCERCHSPKFKGSFHNLYGSNNNTKEQFEEFKKRYEMGEFKIAI